MADILAELLGLMDEPRHARRLLAWLAADAVRAEHRALVEAGACALETPDVPGGRATTVCRFKTPCGAPVEAAVFFEPVTGAVTGRVDLIAAVAGTCPEMLTDGALRLLAARSMGETIE